MNWTELVIFVIFVIITVGGWISGAQKKSEERRRRTQWGSDDVIITPTKSPSSEVPRAHEVAAKRREKLAQLAAERRRAKGLRSQAQPSKAKPQNLTITESTERERAIIKYKERALRLQQERAKQQAKPSRPTQAKTPSRKPQRSAAAHQQTVKPPSTQSRKQKAPVRGQLDQRQLESSIEGRGKSLSKVADHHLEDHPKGEVHRLVPDAVIPSKTKPSRVKSPGLLGVSMRQAFIVKELLDRPVGMRDISELPGGQMM